jgi:hypothetical protein
MSSSGEPGGSHDRGRDRLGKIGEGIWNGRRDDRRRRGEGERANEGEAREQAPRGKIIGAAKKHPSLTSFLLIPSHWRGQSPS